MHKETVIFLHVPRTAGTTLHQIIDRQYNKQADYWIGRDSPDEREFIRMSADRRAEIRMLRGHIAFGLDEHIPGPVAYFTVLREPIERVTSFYYFVQREPEHYAHEMVLAEGMTLQRYVESRATLVTNNFATRMISGMWGRQAPELCSKETLALAKRNLAEHIVVAGLTERFDETLLLLRRRFGWRNVFYRRLNTTERPQTASLNAETLAVLREHNQFDLELYAYAKQLFEDKVTAQGQAFAASVRRFRTVNWLVQPLLRARQKAREILAGSRSPGQA